MQNYSKVTLDVKVNKTVLLLNILMLHVTLVMYFCPYFPKVILSVKGTVSILLVNSQGLTPSQDSWIFA
jgi:hypothetical protein